MWTDRTMPTRSILMVTHNIDEAVSLADRLIALAADPGRIRADLRGLPLEARLCCETALHYGGGYWASNWNRRIS
jgi:ABC-type nitrate/sulfonate/bicarbonate transport system ATPase subunit